MKDLNFILDKIEKRFNPLSVFLYGSRSRTDFLDESDYEIGVLMHKKNYISRNEIKKEINENGISIYPFKYEDFLKGNIDTPLPKINLFIRINWFWENVTW